MPNLDLVVEAFILLRDAFFDDNGEPVPFAHWRGIPIMIGYAL